MKKVTDTCTFSLNLPEAEYTLTHENRNELLAARPYTVIQHVSTHLFPHLGIPMAWMMYTATWKKKTKKKKKKLKELSDLKGKKNPTKTDVITIKHVIK